MKLVQQAVGDLEDFMGTKLHFYGKEQFVMAEFGKKERMLQARELQLEKDNEFKLEPFYNKKMLNVSFSSSRENFGNGRTGRLVFLLSFFKKWLNVSFSSF